MRKGFRKRKFKRYLKIIFYILLSIESLIRFIIEIKRDIRDEKKER